MADYRRFTKVDWYGWAGAEKFNETQQPFIYERELNDGLVGMVIIADRNGIGIYLLDSETDDETVFYYKEKHYTSIVAEGELKHLIKHLEQYTYAPDITYELDHSTDDSARGFYDCSDY